MTSIALKSTIGFVCPGSIWISRATRSRSHVVRSIHSDALACILHRRESINHGKGIKTFAIYLRTNKFSTSQLLYRFYRVFYLNVFQCQN